MKRLRVFVRHVVLTIVLFILMSSCKKEIQTQPSNELTNVAATDNNSCKAVMLGIVGQYNGSAEPSWATTMQKWYGTDGKVSYIKANLRFDDPVNMLEPIVGWGEVTYHGNQVYVRNVPMDNIVMRVTVDDQQRAVASYFNATSPPYESLIDTSYYYYTNGRLDSTLSMGSPPPLSTIPGLRYFKKHKFYYDSFGNLIVVELYLSVNQGSGEFSVSTLQLKYDYSKPITNMLPPFSIQTPFRLLQFLDLLNFPVHHRLIGLTTGPQNMFRFERYNQVYSQFQELDNGLVYSYFDETSYTQNRYYIGWECNSNRISIPRASSQEISSLIEFNHRFGK